MRLGGHQVNATMLNAMQAVNAKWNATKYGTFEQSSDGANKKFLVKVQSEEAKSAFDSLWSNEFRGETFGWTVSIVTVPLSVPVVTRRVD